MFSIRKITSILLLLFILLGSLIFSNNSGAITHESFVEGNAVEDNLLKAYDILSTSVKKIGSKETYYSDTMKLAEISQLADKTISNMIKNNSDYTDSGKCAYIFSKAVEVKAVSGIEDEKPATAATDATTK